MWHCMAMLALLLCCQRDGLALAGREAKNTILRRLSQESNWQIMLNISCYYKQQLIFKILLTSSGGSIDSWTSRFWDELQGAKKSNAVRAFLLGSSIAAAHHRTDP